MRHNILLLILFVPLLVYQLYYSSKTSKEGVGFNTAAASQWFGNGCECYNKEKSKDENIKSWYCSCDYWWKSGKPGRCKKCCGKKPTGNDDPGFFAAKKDAANICANALSSGSAQQAMAKTDDLEKAQQNVGGQESFTLNVGAAPIDKKCPSWIVEKLKEANCKPCTSPGKCQETCDCLEKNYFTQVKCKLDNYPHSPYEFYKAECGGGKKPVGGKGGVYHGKTGATAPKLGPGGGIHHKEDKRIVAKMEKDVPNETIKALQTFSTPGNMEKLGQGCCRFGGIPPENYKYKGRKTLGDCLQLCSGDPTCRGADFSNPKGDKFKCFNYVNDKDPNNYRLGCQDNVKKHKSFGIGQCFKKVSKEQADKRSLKAKTFKEKEAGRVAAKLASERGASIAEQAEAAQAAQIYAAEQAGHAALSKIPGEVSAHKHYGIGDLLEEGSEEMIADRDFRHEMRELRHEERTARENKRLRHELHNLKRDKRHLRRDLTMLEEIALRALPEKYGRKHRRHHGRRHHGRHHDRHHPSRQNFLPGEYFGEGKDGHKGYLKRCGNGGPGCSGGGAVGGHLPWRPLGSIGGDAAGAGPLHPGEPGHGPTREQERRHDLNKIHQYIKYHENSFHNRKEKGGVNLHGVKIGNGKMAWCIPHKDRKGKIVSWIAKSEPRMGWNSNEKCMSSRGGRTREIKYGTGHCVRGHTQEECNLALSHLAKDDYWHKHPVLMGHKRQFPSPTIIGNNFL